MGKNEKNAHRGLFIPFDKIRFWNGQRLCKFDLRPLTVRTIAIFGLKNCPFPMHGVQSLDAFWSSDLFVEGFFRGGGENGAQKFIPFRPIYGGCITHRMEKCRKSQLLRQKEKYLQISALISYFRTMKSLKLVFFSQFLIKTHQFYVLPPFEKLSIKSHRFYVLPPLKNYPSKLIGFMYSPLWKITVFGGRLIRGGRLLRPNWIFWIFLYIVKHEDSITFRGFLLSYK